MCIMPVYHVYECLCKPQHNLCSPIDVNKFFKHKENFYICSLRYVSKIETWNANLWYSVLQDLTTLKLLI